MDSLALYSFHWSPPMKVAGVLSILLPPNQMQFKEKYTTNALEPGNKTVISTDAYAVGEMIEILILSINKKRLIK